MHKGQFISHKFRSGTISDAALAAAVLKAGEPLVFPTDTVVGIGVSVAHPEALPQLYKAKGRDEDKPVAWLVGSPGALDRYGAYVPGYARALAERFWPSGLTLVVKASSEVPPEFQSANATIGLRMPDSEAALELIGLAGSPIATTSANTSGSRPPRGMEDVPAEFAPGVARFGDGEGSGLASTVVDCTGVAPIVLRAGTIPSSDIEGFLKGGTCA